MLFIMLKYVGNIKRDKHGFPLATYKSVAWKPRSQEKSAPHSEGVRVVNSSSCSSSSNSGR